MLEIINKGAVSHLPFSPAIIAGDFVFVSGQASVDSKTGAIIADSFVGEMTRSFENLKAILTAAQCTLDDVVNIRSYLHDPKDLLVYNDTYRSIFKNHWPTRTTICCDLGSLKYEVDCIAYKGRK